jgi:hypothetical protein
MLLAHDADELATTPADSMLDDALLCCLEMPKQRHTLTEDARSTELLGVAGNT